MHQVVKMVSFVFIISMTHTIEQNLMEIWRSWIEFFEYITNPNLGSAKRSHILPNKFGNRAAPCPSKDRERRLRGGSVK